MTDLFTTFARLGGATKFVPTDRVIDGLDQTAVFFNGDTHRRRDYVFIYAGHELGATVKGRYKRHWIGAGEVAASGMPEAYYDLYQDPREENPQLVPFQLPPGNEIFLDSEDESSVDAQSSLIPGAIPAAAIILTIIVALFNGLRPPLIIILTISFALIGIVAGLLPTGTPFGFMALLGAMSLAGMMIKNSIVLLFPVLQSIDRWEKFVQMGFEPDKVIFDIRVFQDIMASECFQRLHPEEFKVKVHRPKQIINSSTAKEFLIRIIERFPWSIVSQ